MGCYINPPDMTKEDFLAKHGTKISKADFKSAAFNPLQAEGKMVVIHVNNGPFTAAGIANTERELQYWQDQIDHDPRPANFFTCPVELLTPYL